jgi:signal peptidase I
MEPTLARGDIVRLESPESLKLGDVITFELNGKLYTHRVVRLAGDTVFCRGDNHVWGDPGVSRSKVVGRVTEVIGRGSLPPIHLNLSAIGLRHALRRSLIRGRHLAAEMKLLVCQIEGRVPIGHVGLSSWGVPADVLGDDAQVLAPRDVGVKSVTPAAGIDRIIVPAGIYSRLSRAERLSLLRALTPERVVVLALPRDLMGRLPRRFGWLRRSAASAGLQIGHDGDAMVTSGTLMTAGYVHYFGESELSEEIRVALPARSVTVNRESSAWGSLLVGRVTPEDP